MSLTKFESQYLDLHIWSYKIYKTVVKTENLNYLMNTQPLTCGTRLSAGPTGQRDEIGEAHATARHMAKFADGDSSDETTATSVFPKVSRVD